LSKIVFWLLYLDFAGFKLIPSAAVGAAGNTFFVELEKDFGVTAPKRHSRVWARDRKVVLGDCNGLGVFGH
jgi:hypothetical protein